MVLWLIPWNLSLCLFNSTLIRQEVSTLLCTGNAKEVSCAWGSWALNPITANYVVVPVPTVLSDCQCTCTPGEISRRLVISENWPTWSTTPPKWRIRSRVEALPSPPPSPPNFLFRRGDARSMHVCANISGGDTSIEGLLCCCDSLGNFMSLHVYAWGIAR